MSKFYEPTELSTEVIHVRCTKTQKNTLEVEAKLRGLSVSKLIKLAVEEYLKNN